MGVADDGSVCRPTERGVRAVQLHVPTEGSGGDRRRHPGLAGRAQLDQRPVDEAGAGRAQARGGARGRSNRDRAHLAFCNMVGVPPLSGGGARRVAWDRGRDDALVFGQFRARTVPGAVWRDAGASAQSWLAVGSVSRALPEVMHRSNRSSVHAHMRMRGGDSRRCRVALP